MSQESHLKRRRGSLHQSFRTLMLILLLSLAIRIGLQQFHIQGESMEPTLHNQEYIMVSKVSYLLEPPARGDIIVFQYPRNPQHNYIKRIIAIPGDIISVIGETVIINGVTLHETYVNPKNQDNPYASFRKRIVSPDEYFVMGDNRGDSSDSRDWGFVPRDNIIGKVEFIYWPFGVDNLGPIPNERSVFAKVQ